MAKVLRRLFRDETGATAIEYGLIVALIVVAIIAAIGGVGGLTGSIWSNMSNKVATATPTA